MPATADLHATPTAVLCAQPMMPRALRLLGAAVILAGLLSACSTPTKGGGVGQGANTAADAREVAEYRYIYQATAQIRKTWNHYCSQKPYDVAYGDLPVEFAVNTAGKLSDIHVRNTYKTNPDLTRLTVKAIQETKLPPMPADLIAALKAQGRESLKFGCIVHNPPPQKETKRLMDGRWGMPRSGTDELSVNLTSKESSARQGKPATLPTKGASASGGTKTTVKLTATPKERYIERVTAAVEKKWHHYRMMEMAGVTYASLEVVFYVNKMGQVVDVRVVNDKNSYRDLTLFTLRAIKDADIPRMPADVISSLPMNDPERLKIEYNVLIY